jgi:D-aminopeptidase
VGRQITVKRRMAPGCVNKACIFLIVFLFAHAAAADAVRARNLGIPFDGTPGPLNAITDVEGVTVGHETIIRDLADNRAVRTGVTAIFPRGRRTIDRPVFAGSFALNANGEMTGLAWVEESGFLESPVMITNTHSVGIVHQATIEWRVARAGADLSGYFWSTPVVGETWDGTLNDINGFHVKREHVYAALESASDGPVAEGSVGGGTGMICFEFKCGIGTSSRVVAAGDDEFTVGVLLQANFGGRESLRVAGVPVGRHMQDRLVLNRKNGIAVSIGSIIIVIATDAPLMPHQLRRISKRASMGIARTGDYASNGSGDFFIAFSTANVEANQAARGVSVSTLANEDLDPLFLATVEATEEAIINALVAGRDMTGDLGHSVKGIDHDELIELLRQYNRYAGE